jgi:DNA-binding SARP family transcriptional activator
MPALVSARLLGPPDILIDGQPPPPELMWRKHQALCIALWTAPECTRSRDQLIGLLWSDKTDRAARHSLNEALRVIRRAVGDDAIDTTGDHVRWTAAIALDTARFAALEEADPAAAAELVTGAYCDGLVVTGAQELDAWLSGERERWQGRSVDVLVRAASAAEDRGDIRAARALAERAIALNALSDRAVQALIRAHWLEGDRGAALAAGESYRARIDRELGLDLDERTATLLARVGRERRPTRPAGAPVSARRTPLIGREALLAAMTEHARSGGPLLQARVLIISGAAGSGRSRVIDELVARAVMDGATVAMMRAVDADAADADAAVIGLARAGLESAPGVAGVPANVLAAFTNRIPAWTERFRDLPATDAASLRDAFAAVVRATAEERPVMLVIDDADRLHPDELRWFPAFLRETGNAPVTLLLAARTGMASAATDDLLRQAGRDIPGSAERLAPLTVTDLQQLVDWAVPGWSAEARDRLARRVWVESAGLPAIAVDVLQAVRNGLGFDTDAAWPAPEQTLDQTLPGPLPEPLVASVRVEFRRLTADAQTLLTAMALLEEPCPGERAGRVAQVEELARRDAALDELEWEGWVVLDGRGYSFPARTKRRLVARDMLTPGQRRRLEERIAACP